MVVPFVVLQLARSFRIISGFLELLPLRKAEYYSLKIFLMTID
jgi:hypothetical protein